MPPIDTLLPAALRAEDTIAAIATPPGRGGLGVLRVSGPRAAAIADELLRRARPRDWPPRRPALARLVDAQGEVVDEVLATFFPKPASYTAEDVVEISCHGSPAVLGLALERALRAGARLAEPGEFTLRAYRNGRLDLVQAEAVRDLIESTTTFQARVAARQLGGELSRRLGPLKRGLTDLIALLEAGIDFAEDDLAVPTDDELLGRLDPVERAVEALIAGFQYGKVVRSGITLAVLGRPNVGKSSLFNRLLEKERAIVTPIAGTTRDIVSDYAEIEGLPVQLLDTAGIRSTSDVVEVEGVERSWAALSEADLILAVVDLSRPLEATDWELIRRAEAVGGALVVGNKADIAAAECTAPADALRVSAKSGEGVAELRRAIADRAAPAPDEGREAAFITNARHEELLRRCAGKLADARRAIASRVPHEMSLLDLYAALEPLDAMTGATTADDVLVHIFSTFCIGK